MDTYGISCASRALAQLSPISVWRFHIFSPRSNGPETGAWPELGAEVLGGGSGPQWGQGTQVPSKLKYGLVGGWTSIFYFPRNLGNFMEFRIIPKNWRTLIFFRGLAEPPTSWRCPEMGGSPKSSWIIQFNTIGFSIIHQTILGPPLVAQIYSNIEESSNCGCLVSRNDPNVNIHENKIIFAVVFAMLERLHPLLAPWILMMQDWNWPDVWFLSETPLWVMPNSRHPLNPFNIVYYEF